MAALTISGHHIFSFQDDPWLSSDNIVQKPRCYYCGTLSAVRHRMEHDSIEDLHETENVKIVVLFKSSIFLNKVPQVYPMHPNLWQSLTS